MNDNDDIRFSSAEDRPPWELSPAGQFREWFSCRKVDDATAGYCREVEAHKKARVKAQTHRSASHARLQRQREEAQSRLVLEQQAAKQRMAEARARVQANPEGKDPNGQRYTYDSPPPRKPGTPPPIGQSGGNPPRRSNDLRRKRKKSSPAALLVVIIACVVSAVFGYLSEREDEVENFTAQIPKIELPTQKEETPTEADGDDFASRFRNRIEGGDEWDNLLPDADEEEPIQSAIPRADSDPDLSLSVQSAAGLTAMSYQELYQKCAPTTVSIRVYAESGGGTGTGIIMTADGYILTCNHLVAGGNRCTVTTWEGEEYEALLLGADPQTDLAVLKIDAEGLTPAQFGDSDELTVGDEVIAIGDPLGTELRGTMTNGIVSAINRNVTVKSYPMTLIQTTAALNAGNSGGPLINLYGQVVGVNNMKMVSSAITVEGLGFAVPTSVIRRIVPVLAAEGKVSRPVLGITCYEVDEEMMEAEGLPATGLWVSTVNAASKAKAAGLLPGDIITAVNGEPVTKVSQVRDLLNELGIGEKVTLSVCRPGEEEDDEAQRLEFEVEIVDQAELK